MEVYDFQAISFDFDKSKESVLYLNSTRIIARADLIPLLSFLVLLVLTVHG
jgi:hypothetical protein